MCKIHMKYEIKTQFTNLLSLSWWYKQLNRISHSSNKYRNSKMSRPLLVYIYLWPTSWGDTVRKQSPLSTGWGHLLFSVLKSLLRAFTQTQNAPVKLRGKDIKWILPGRANHNNYFGDFWRHGIKIWKNWPNFSRFNPLPSLPSDDRKQFQCRKIVFNNKIRGLRRLERELSTTICIRQLK